MSQLSHRGLGLGSLLQNFGKTVGRQVWSAALQLAVIVLVARAYGPHGNGIYSVALLLPAMLSLLLALGIAPANVFYLASKRHGIRAVAATTMRLWLALSLGGTAIGWLVLAKFGAAWFPGVPQVTLYLALLAFPPVLFNSLIGSIFQGVEDFSGFNLSLALHPLTCLIGVGTCVLVGLSADFAVAAYGAGGTAAAVALWLRLRRSIAAEKLEAAAPYELHTVLSYGLKSHLGSIVAFLNLRIGLFQLNLLTTPAIAGVYIIAAQLAERMWILSLAVSTVLVPRLSAISSNRERSTAMMAVVSRVTVLATTVMAFCAALIGPVAIPLLFGQQFEAAYFPFLMVLPGILAGSSVRILSAEFSARGRPEINTYMAIAVLLVNIPCNALLIPRFGASGAAASSSIAYIFSLAVRVVVYRSFTGESASSLLIPRRSDLSAILAFFKKR